MIKITKKELPKIFDEYFTLIDHDHNTRTKQISHFNLLQPRTYLGRQSVRFNGVKIWANLPSNLKYVQSYILSH